MSRNRFLVLCVLVVFVLLIILVVVEYSYRETYQDQNIKPPWYDIITERFFTTLQRPIDVIHQRYYTTITQNLPITRAVNVINDDIRLYHDGVQKGIVSASNQKIIIAGLLQNCFRHIPQLMDRCNKIASKFKDYRIIILENNSTDESRKYLLEWAAMNKKVTILCNDAYSVNAEECDIFAAKVENDHSPMPHRIQRMAYLRNIYMDHIKHYYSDYDLLCVMDMDLEGEIFIDGLLHSVWLLDKKRATAITCNGMIMRDDGNYYYYDSFAYVQMDDPAILTDMASKSKHDNYVHAQVTMIYSTQMSADRVSSAFGGLAIYRLPKVVDNRYSFSSTQLTCEHSFFHQNIDVYVNPRMIFLIERNG